MGVAIGFWVFVGIRMLNHLVEVGVTSRLLIETIDRTFVETIAAALVAVLAAAAAIASRTLAHGTRNTPLVWAASALALATLVTAVWRVI